MLMVTAVKRQLVRSINKRKLAKVGCNLKKNTTINGVIKVYGLGFITIGSQTRINSGEKYNPIGGAGRTIFSLRNNGKIVIGNNVGISNSTFVSRDEIVIEDDVRIGGNCKIYDNDFHSIIYENRISNSDMDIKSSPVRIRKGAFIGAHTIVLKGVTIGVNSVVGAGSVVTKSIPDGEIWAGNPASFIRKI